MKDVEIRSFQKLNEQMRNYLRSLVENWTMLGSLHSPNKSSRCYLLESPLGSSE